MRRALALAAPLLAVAVLPAHAAPAETARVAIATVSYPAPAGGIVKVELFARSGSDGDRIEVGVERCARTCTAWEYYEGSLPPGALQIDAKAATAGLRATLGGLRVQVAWAPDSGTPSMQGGIHDGGNQDHSWFAVYQGDRATAAVRVRDAGCTVDAAVGDQVAVTTPGSNAVDAPLSTLRLPVPARSTCG